MGVLPSSYWFKSAFFTIFQRVSMLLFGVGGFLILIRTLSKENFGIWSLFVVISGILEVSRNGLIKNPLIKYLGDTEAKAEKAKIVASSFALNFIYALVSILLIIILAVPLSKLMNAPDLSDILYFYIITVVLLTPFFQFEFIQQANFNFKGIFFAYFTRQGMFFVSILILFLFRLEVHPLQYLIFTYAFSTLAGTAVSYIFARRYFTLSGRPEKKWIKALFHFGKFTFATNVSAIILRATDHLMLGALISPASVAVYNTSMRITNLLEIPSTAFADIVFPKSVQRMVSDGKEGVKFLYEKSVGILFAFIIPGIIFVFVFSELIVLTLAGDAYKEAIPVLQITVLYNLFIPVSKQFANACNALGKPQINFYLILSGAILNLVFNYIFIMNMGLSGAAYATLTTYIITVCTNQIILYKLLGAKTLNAFKYFKIPYVYGYQKLVSIF